MLLAPRCQTNADRRVRVLVRGLAVRGDQPSRWQLIRRHDGAVFLRTTGRVRLLIEWSAKATGDYRPYLVKKQYRNY